MSFSKPRHVPDYLLSPGAACSNEVPTFAAVIILLPLLPTWQIRNPSEIHGGAVGIWWRIAIHSYRLSSLKACRLSSWRNS
jgi:hypothetical protein